MRGLKPEHSISLKEKIQQHFPQLNVEINRGIPVIRTETGMLPDLMNLLKNDSSFGFNVLIELTAVDYLAKREPGSRFDIVYMLWSTDTMQRVRVVTTAGEGDKVPTMTGLWKGANWPEREVFDLFGVEFSGHPVMERIVMPEEFRGHPLRKDFPLEGRGEDYLIESILIDRNNNAE